MRKKNDEQCVSEGMPPSKQIKTRSGRVIVPPLEYWKNVDRNIDSERDIDQLANSSKISMNTSPHPCSQPNTPKGSTSSSYEKKNKEILEKTSRSSVKRKLFTQFESDNFEDGASNNYHITPSDDERFYEKKIPSFDLLQMKNSDTGQKQQFSGYLSSVLKQLEFQIQSCGLDKKAIYNLDAQIKQVEALLLELSPQKEGNSTNIKKQTSFLCELSPSLKVKVFQTDPETPFSHWE